VADDGGLRAALGHAEVRSIARRYLVSNGFDGALTSIGVAVGSFLSGVPDGVAIVRIGLGAAVGLGTSGVWSVWEIERAERAADLGRIEQAMLTDLDDTHLDRSARAARAVTAIASGIGPLVGVLLPMVPFLLEGWLVSMPVAAAASVAVGVVVLFGFGSYMGGVAGLNPYVTGVRMGLAGLFVALVTLVTPG
jgi:predicted membrane protein (TIGR00267 family)